VRLLASENPAKPMWRDNVWYRHIRPALEKVGLGWANFQVLRRTHASLGNELKVDPKVAADQRGHGIGVALDVYTKSSIEARRGAAEKLEDAVLGDLPQLNGGVLESGKLLMVPKLLILWSGRRDSNPRRPAWENGVRLKIKTMLFLALRSGDAFPSSFQTDLPDDP